MENVIGMIGDSVRRLLFVLMAVVLLPVFASAQGSFPSVDDFKLSSGALVNRAGDSLIFVDATGGDTVLIMSDNKFKVFDTLFCLNELIINADSATTSNLFFSNGLTNYIRWNASTSRFVLSHPLTLASLYSSGSNLDFYVSGTLEGRISSSGITAEDGSFYKDVVSADSGMATKHYADHYFVDDSIVVGVLASRGNNWVPAWDSANTRWTIEQQQGDTGALLYGELYDSISSGQTITCSTAVFRGWNDTVVAGNVSGMTYVNIAGGTTERRGDGLIVDSTGVYMCLYTASFSGTNSAVLEAALFVNSTIQPDLHFIRTLGNPASTGDAGFLGLVSLTAGDTVNVRWKASTDGHTATVAWANLSVVFVHNQSGGGGGSGTSDSVAVVDSTGTVYDNFADYIRLKEGVGIKIGREDSTAYDLLRVLLDTANAIFDSSIYADTAGAISGANIYGANSIDTSLLLDVVTLLGQSIETGDITDQTIIKDDIDTTTSFTFAPSFIGDGLQTDSAIATKGYVDAQAAPNLDTLMRNIGDTAGASSRYDLGAALTVDSIEGVTGGYATRWWSQQVRTKVIYDPDDNGFLIGGDGNDSIIIVGLPYHYNGISSVPADSQLMTKGYIDSITVTYADSAGRLREDSLTLAMIGQNGASDGQIMKWSSGSSAWVVGSDNTGSPFWDTVNTYGLNWFALVNGSDTLLNIQRTAGAVGKADTIDIFPADSAVLRLGAAGVTSVDSLAIDVDTITHLTGTFILNRGDTLHVDTGATGLKNYIAAYAGAVVSDSTAGDVDTAGTQIAAALDDRIRTNGDTTSQATFDFSSSRLEDIDYIIADSVGVTSTEFMRWDASNTRFSFSDDIYTGNTVIGNALYAYNNSIYANSAAGGSADNYFGMYVYDGSQTGASMLYRASSDFWKVSHSIYVNDTTDTDSLLTTEYHVRGLVTDTADAVRAEIRDTATVVVTDSLTDMRVNDFWANTVADLDLTTSNATNASTWLKLPYASQTDTNGDGTFDITFYTDSGGAVHPSVVAFDDYWNGYKYWISFTVIPALELHTQEYLADNENFFLCATNDFVTFDPIGGDSTAIFDTSSFPGSDYLSDVELFKMHDGRLGAMVRVFYTDTIGLCFAYSNDGDTWTYTNGTDTNWVWRNGFLEGPVVDTGRTLYSPWVEADTNGSYDMFVVEAAINNGVGDAGIDTAFIVKWESPYGDSGWTLVDTITWLNNKDWTDSMGYTTPAADSVEHWHIGGTKIGGNYIGISAQLNDTTLAESGDGYLFLASSTDGGQIFTPADTAPILRQSGDTSNWDGFHLYRSDIFPIYTGNGMKLGMLYTGKHRISGGIGDWNVGYTEITLNQTIRDTVEAVLDTIPIAINLLDTIEVDDELFIKMPTGGTLIGVYYDLLEGDSVRCRLYELGATTDTTSKVSVTDSVFSVTATYDSTVSFSNAVFDAGDYLYFGVESVHGDVGKLILNAIFTR